jgi:diguanylate cyclase (GGDEF)-like protein
MWARALTATYAGMSWADMVSFLSDLTGLLADAMRADEFDRRLGLRVGTELVAHDFAAAEALGLTLSALHTGLLCHLGLSGDPAAEQRLVELAEAIAVGHSRAVRDRVLDGQEAVRIAAVTARDRAERQLRRAEAARRHDALHDPVTGLPNRTWLTGHLGLILSHARGTDERLALAVIGLDAFERISDSLGPRVGDQLLHAVAGRLRVFAAETGGQVARLDGDAFALLIEATTAAEDAIKVVDNALRVLGEPFQVEAHELPVDARAGIVERAADGCEPTELLRAAGLSLRWAKADRVRDWALFDEARNNEHLAVHRLSAAMPTALARGEFVLHYQPLIDLRTRRRVGVEGLARWRHPELGTIGPERFIPLAENTGLIIPLGLQLLEQACAQAVSWADLVDDPPYVSVNLSDRQIRHVGLVADITAVLDRTGLPPERLHLEITEGAIFDNGPDMVSTLDNLAGQGISLALDDFGTGYANHAILPVLPIRTLKLAGSLVRRLGSPAPDPRDEAVVSHVIALGHSLGLTVTGEGIESTDQEGRLRSLGCDTGQGWLFGRPVPALDLERALAVA